MKFLSKHHNFLHLNKEVILYVTSFISRSIRHEMILKSVCKHIWMSRSVFVIKSKCERFWWTYHFRKHDHIDLDCSDIYLPTHVHSCQQQEAFKLFFFLCANKLLKTNKTNKISFREGNVVERLKVKLINLLRENHSNFFYESKKK